MIQFSQSRFTDTTFPSALLPFTKDAVFFDIETTGLSPTSASIFMIGIAWWNGTDGIACQWICDDPSPEGERQLLSIFFQTLDEKGAHILYVYNGRSFDMPFIQKRCIRLGLDFSFKSYQVIDLYRELAPYRKLFPLKNYKLRSFEQFLGYGRRDKLDGKALIRLFFSWTQTKDPASLDLLYLHNLDDLRGFVHIFSLVVYIRFFQGAFTPVEIRMTKDLCQICLESDTAFPVPVGYEQFGMSFHGEGRQAFLSLPIYREGIRYYYPDWKNYVFLTEEGYAIHRSMAAYVDRSHYVPATQEQCYTFFKPGENFADDPDAIRKLCHMTFGSFGFSGKPTFLDTFRI